MINEDPGYLAPPLTPNDGRTRKMGPVQIRAEGNVRLDGRSQQQGIFGATADWASYDQKKEVFLLKGFRSLAQVWQRPGPNEPAQIFPAKEITFNRRTGLPDAKGVQQLEFTPTARQSGSVPGPTRQ
jgi:hypothetical protein